MKTTTLLGAIPALFVLTFVLWVASSTAVPERNLSKASAAEVNFNRKTNAVMGLARSSLVRPPLPSRSHQPLEVSLPLDGIPRTLSLIPYSVRSENFEILAQNSDGTFKKEPRRPVRTFRGEVRGIKDSFVTAAHLPDGLHARIHLPDGGEHWLEPIGRRIADAKAGDHIIYKSDDVLEAEGICAANDFADVQAALEAAATQSTSGAEQLSIAEIACDADFEYYQRWGSVAAAADRIESIINAVNVQYERDVAISHVVGTIIVRTSPGNPYTSTDPNTLLNQFRSHWENNQTGIQRDVAHLFTGKELDGNVIGVAWLSGICGSFGYGLSQSDFSSNFASVTDLTAHELGHNWGAGHCSCSGYTMNPSITSANQFNPANTIPVIAAFRDSRSCLDQGAPTPPESPSDLVATAISDSVIDLAWTDNSTIEQGFDIDRSDDGGLTWAMLASVGANTTTYQDSGLPAETTFHYRVNAYNNTGDSNFTNSASATTLPLPAPPVAPDGLTATAQSESRIDLGWNDTSANEDGFEIARLDGATWLPIGTTGPNATSFSDTGLNPSTSYSYQVRSFNSGGESAYSASASATTDDPPPFIDQVAQSETPVSGSVTGSYQQTNTDDGNVQLIRERQSNGKKSRRFSFLEHVWQFDVLPGNSITLFGNAWSSGSNDGDTFQFEYSTNGTNYSPAFVVSSTNSGNIQSAGLPTSISGTLFVRVVDTDRTQGNRSLDSIIVDHLFVRSDLVAGSPPAAPSDLVASASAGSVLLNWVDQSADEYGFQIERSEDGAQWTQIDSTSQDSTSFEDANVLPATSYHYRVRAFNGSGSSAYTNEATATTPEGITLVSADGYKVKGRQRVDIVWTGSSSDFVEIRRDGELIETTANDGAYTDLIGSRGGGQYEYRVCDEGGTSCSNAVIVNF